MSGKRNRYVVVYDIPDDRRRNYVARILEGHGERVQYSVFECVLTARQFESLWQALKKQVKAEEDSIRAYTLCDLCAGRTQHLGRPGPSAEVPEVYIA